MPYKKMPLCMIEATLAESKLRP